MTQIQIRRDTETNWTSVNPTLALGEWGYDITNKVCKIGDGTTPWNTLPVYGGESELPIATVTTAGIVKPDGSTITVTADGTISATASGGASDYTELTNKPKINSVELNGNVSLASLNVYDKDEVDGQLLLKENKITAVSPINLSYYVKSNLEGFTYTTEGDGVYATAGVGYYAGTSDNASWISVGVGTDTFEGATGFNPKGYIDIPYSIGQTLLTPPGVTFYGNRTFPVIFGKILPSGDFIPLCYSSTGTYSGGHAIITTSDTPSTASSSVLNFPNVVIGGAKLTVGNRTNTNLPGLHGLIRISKASDSTYYVDQDARYMGGSTHGIYTARYTVTDSTLIARLEEITTARIFPNAYSESGKNYGVNAGNPFYVNAIGLYNDLPLNGNIDFDTLTNLFEIGKETAYNYLELNLSATEGNLLTINEDGLYATGGSYTLPVATTSTLGGVKPDGTSITITADGVISAALEGYAQTSDIPTATSDLTNDSGFITNSVNNLTNYTLTSDLAAVATSGSYNDLTDKPTIPSEYVLPTASASVLGGVKIGNGVSVTNDGTLSVASVNGFKFWSGTQTAYNGIATKDPNTLYIITGE